MEQKLNGYIGFYNGKRAEFYDTTAYGALKQAREYFKPTKARRHMVHARLAELGDKPVVHTADN